MRKVRVESLHGQSEIEFPDIKLAIEDGEEVLLPDDQAEIVLRNPNVVDAVTGKNPNFTCAGCGKTTYTIARFERHRISKTRGPHTSARVNGKIYCDDCPLPDEAEPEPLPNEAAVVQHVDELED